MASNSLGTWPPPSPDSASGAPLAAWARVTWQLRNYCISVLEIHKIHIDSHQWSSFDIINLEISALHSERHVLTWSTKSGNLIEPCWTCAWPAHPLQQQTRGLISRYLRELWCRYRPRMGDQIWPIKNGMFGKGLTTIAVGGDFGCEIPTGWKRLGMQRCCQQQVWFDQENWASWADQEAYVNDKWREMPTTY